MGESAPTAAPAAHPQPAGRLRELRRSAPEEGDEMGLGPGIRRREFLKGASVTLGAFAAGELLSLSVLRPASAQGNPLAEYPNRDWEVLYRDVYTYDDSFVFDAKRLDAENALLKRGRC
jgi:hypothetical protein